MNWTNWEHGVIAMILNLGVLVFFCLVLNPSFWLIVCCMLPGPYFFAGREHTQQEMRLKNKYGEKEITHKITIEALKFWEWDRDSQLDLYMPIIFSICLGLISCVVLL